MFSKSGFRGFTGKSVDFILSSVFPGVCFICGSDGLAKRKSSLKSKVCAKCEADFIFLSSQNVCYVCGNTVAGKKGSLCGPCSVEKRSFSIARSVLFFSGSAAACARDFKYRGAFSTAAFLSSLTVDSFPEDFGDFQTVVPVPLHLRRLREREFNQSALVSSRVALHFGKKHAPFVLKRVKDNPPQASISSHKERRANVRAAFSVRRSEAEKIRNRRVMLFDDIFTTGSTIEECSAMLVHAGAREVKSLTIFRTPI